MHLPAYLQDAEMGHTSAIALALIGFFNIIGTYGCGVLGGIFPKGLVIGSVSKVARKKQGLFQEITLVPSSDLSKLEEVLVFLS